MVIRYVGTGLVPVHYVLPKKKEEIGTQEQDVNDHQSPTRKSGFQPRKQIDRGSEHDQSLYRREDTGVVIPIPVRDGTFKDEIGERKEMMMPVIVMRPKVETEMDEHAPRENDDSLGVQEVISYSQNDQN